MKPTKQEIIERCKLSTSTIELLEGMDDKTYKEMAGEVIFLARPIIAKQEMGRIASRIASRIEVDMPSITRYGALQYLRDLWKDLGGKR